MQQRLQVEGPVDYRVYQRNEQGLADIEYTLRLDQAAGREVMLRTDHMEGTSSWTSAGVLDGSGCFHGVSRSVPTGTFFMRFRIMGGEDGGVIAETAIGPLFVGDLWVLAGQSNMEGCGYLSDLEEPVSGVSCFYMGDRWGIAEDPLTWLKESVDPVNWTGFGQSEREAAAAEERRIRYKGAGLGVAFGKEIWERTGVPVGLIMCAHGGTSMEQWDPQLKELGGHSLYGAMLRRVRENGGKVAGCLWYQGESDANEAAALQYARRLEDLLRHLRSDLNDGRLPFLYAQLSRFHTWDKAAAVYWNQVQNDQLGFEQKDDRRAMVPTIDASMSDPIHLDANSLKLVGRRFARQALAQVYAIPSGRGPRLSAFRWNASRTCLQLQLDQVQLNGRLRQEAQLYGFHAEADGENFVPQASLTADKTGLELVFDRVVPAGARLYHGAGYYPHVNTADEAGIPLPVFGPVIV